MKRKTLVNLLIAGLIAGPTSLHAYADTDKGAAKNQNAYTGWVKKENAWQYHKQGIPTKGWVSDQGAWYFLGEDANMKTGWLKDGNVWYLLGDNGAMKTGWAKAGDTWYYLDTSGAMKTNWIKDGNVWYLLGENGAMKTGWAKVGDIWYYLQPNGAMKTGWFKDGSSWYYLDSSGAMKTGWIQDNGTSYFLENNGAWNPNAQQVSTERIFHVPGKGDVNQLKDRDRRQFRFSPYEPTGLYANPNEKITIQVEGTQDIQAHIGTYSYDGAWNEDSRIKSFTLKPGENTIESPNGGMIYFYNPQQGGEVAAEIKKGGSPTPFFELGKHTKQDLINMLDTYPNAHAVELKGERSLITASPERVKKYLLGSNTDPVELLKKIDEAIRIEDRVSDLSEEEADKHYVHFVEDNHSNYYMYAYSSRTAYVGDAIQNVLDINKFTKDGWGPWHEMGHQRQQTPWLWDGLGEVTTNIYSMSVQRAFGNKSRLENGTYEKAFTYLNKPQSEKDFNKIDDVFVKLTMFWQLDLAFGEEFYPKLHQLYRSMPNKELPQTNDEKIQAFIYNTSKVAKQNLIPFFDKWGLQASLETKQKIEALNVPTLTAPIWESTDSKVFR